VPDSGERGRYTNTPAGTETNAHTHTHPLETGPVSPALVITPTDINL